MPEMIINGGSANPDRARRPRDFQQTPTLFHDVLKKSVELIRTPEGKEPLDVPGKKEESVSFPVKTR